MYLLGDIQHVQGQALNQQGLYQAEDAVTACWQFAPQADGSQATGSGYWNFAAFERCDKVEIIGNKGRIEFSVFAEEPVKLITAQGTETLFIENPKHIQQFHVANMAKQLEVGQQHPSTGLTAIRATEVMEQILAGRR